MIWYRTLRVDKGLSTVGHFTRARRGGRGGGGGTGREGGDGGDS